MFQFYSDSKIIPPKLSIQQAKWKAFQGINILRAWFFRREKEACWNQQGHSEESGLFDLHLNVIVQELEETLGKEFYVFSNSVHISFLKHFSIFFYVKATGPN